MKRSKDAIKYKLNDKEQRIFSEIKKYSRKNPQKEISIGYLLRKKLMEPEALLKTLHTLFEKGLIKDLTQDQDWKKYEVFEKINSNEKKILKQIIKRTKEHVNQTRVSFQDLKDKHFLYESSLLRGLNSLRKKGIIKKSFICEDFGRAPRKESLTEEELNNLILLIRNCKKEEIKKEKLVPRFAKQFYELAPHIKQIFN